jgi:hypothetical protein
MRKITLGVAALVVMALAIPAAAGKADHFTAHLTELNGSGVTGQAVLWAADDALTVNLTVNGLDRGLVHMQHIHGKTQGAAECPTIDRDTDGDGLISVAEGGPDYGPVLLSLLRDGVFPTPNNGGVAKTMETYSATNAGGSVTDLGPLDSRVIVIHGLDLDDSGAYEPGLEFALPVACGVIVAQP